MPEGTADTVEPLPIFGVEPLEGLREFDAQVCGRFVQLSPGGWLGVVDLPAYSIGAPTRENVEVGVKDFFSRHWWRPVLGASDTDVGSWQS